MKLTTQNPSAEEVFSIPTKSMWMERGIKGSGGLEMGGKRKKKAKELLTADNHNLLCSIAFCIFWKLRQEPWSGTETIMTPSDGAVVL